LLAGISQKHAIVIIEDLQVANMPKSAKGTKEQPGGNLRAKPCLNRSILDKSPFELRRQLEYKAERGAAVSLWSFLIPPQNTTRTCPCCSPVSTENRKTQEKFEVRAMRFLGYADWVTARNI
jgi:putative transposase